MPASPARSPLKGQCDGTRAHAYAAIDVIDWPGGFYRRDIGWRALARDPVTETVLEVKAKGAAAAGVAIKPSPIASMMAKSAINPRAAATRLALL
jgi:hypothetical protein